MEGRSAKDLCKCCALLLALSSVAPARAVIVDVGIDGPVIVFAADELKRILGETSNRITLREDVSLKAQQWRLRSGQDGSLVISGRDGMGIAYGVFTFLEKHVGVRWLAPDTEVIPDLSGWKMPVLDETAAPKYAYREMYVGEDWMNPVWRLRNKETSRAAYGIGVGTGSPADCHTFDAYAKILMEKRPDLFKGRINAKGSICNHLCMTDETTRELVAEQMCAYIAADRAKKVGKPPYLVPSFYDLSQPDGPSGYECMCPNCRRLFEEAGRTYAGPNIAFASAVAEKVAKRYPDVAIQTFAYGYTSDPPTNGLVAVSNVNVRYCNAWLHDPLVKGSPQGDGLEAWARCAKQFGIWSYWRTYRGVLFPFVKKRAEIAAEIRFCAGLGATRYFAEDEAPLARSFAMMQHWLFLKLTEDPSQDVFALSREFIRGYYRAAARPMEAYLDYVEKRQKSGVGCHNEPQKAHLDRAFFEKANAWLDEAETLAKDDPVALRHVHWERVVVDRAMYDLLGGLLKQGYAFDGPRVAQRFLDYSREQIENWDQLQYADQAKTKAARLARIENEAQLYMHFPIPLPSEFDGLEVDTVEWNKLRGLYSEIIKDPDAAAGTAFYDPKFDCKLPFTMGVYNNYLRTGESLQFQTRDDVPQDEKYHVFKIGRQLIQSPMEFYFYGDWRCVQYMPTLGIVPEVREVWISMKFQGPAFVPGSTKPNRVFYDRAFYVKNDNPMRGYEKAGENLVPPERRTMTASCPDGKYKAEWINLGDPAKMDHGLLIRGTCSWKGVLAPSQVDKRPYPFVGLWALTQKGGRNDFTRSCQVFYAGSFEKQLFETVIEAERLRRYVEDATEPLNLTFRINLYNQPATVTVEDLEIVPVRRKR